MKLGNTLWNSPEILIQGVYAYWWHREFKAGVLCQLSPAGQVVNSSLVVILP